MLFNLQNDTDVLKAQERLRGFIDRGVTIDLIEKKNTRTTKQNAALHLFFTIMSSQLNEMGLEFHYYGLNNNTLTTRYTPDVVKNYFWRPIQITLFDIISTKKINTEQINEILDVIIKWFGEKGILIQFPSIETLTK